MTWQPVFETQCDVFPPDETPEPRGELILRVDIDAANKKVRCRVSDGTTEKADIFDISAGTMPDPFDPGDIDTIELALDLSDTTKAQRLSEVGAAGLNLSLAAKLESVRIRLRGPNAGGYWTSEAPSFAILFCWKLTGKVAKDSLVLLEDADGKTTEQKLSAELTAEPIVCAGFSAIHPYGEELTPEDLQVRLDLESLGLSTGWVPLRLIDDGWLSGYHMNGLGRWFAELADALPTFPDIFRDVDLPDWDLDLDVEIDLPLGLAFRNTQLSITREDDQYRIKAVAESLILRWGDASEFEIKDARISMQLIFDGTDWFYVVEVTLFKTKGEAVRFALPFDVLSLGAACWQFRLGLHVSNLSSDAAICPEVLIELGGAEIRSSLSDGGAEPLYKTDLRILMRNFTVMFADLNEAKAPLLFEEYKDDAPFKDFARKIPALSFARDLSAPKPAKEDNDYGIEILDGDVRKGERFFIAWTQRGNQLLKALAYDLTGGEPAGQIPDDAEEVTVALELAWFGPEDARDTQLRLDWSARDAAVLTPGGTPVMSGDGTDEPPEAPTHRCIPWNELADDGLSLPFKSSGVNLTDPLPKSRQITLPGLSIQVAEPEAHSVIIRQEADGDTSVGYLLIYDAPSASGSKPAAAIALAKFGFSMADTDAGTRETLDTDKGKFATLGLGYGGAESTALRVIGWRVGQSPRFIEAYDRGAHPIPKLIPNKSPGGGSLGCPVPAPPPKAPVPLAFNSFAAPRFNDADGWRLSLRFAAEKAFFRLFSRADEQQETAPVSYTITHICLPLDKDGNIDGDLDHVLVDTELSIRLDGGFEATGNVRFRLDPATLALSIDGEAQLAVALATMDAAPGWAEQVPLPELGEGQVYAFSEEKEFLNLKANFLSAEGKDANPKAIEFLRLTVNDGRFKLALPDDKHMVLRFDGLGNDSLNFWVDAFEIGPGGLDVEARLVSSALNVKGLKKPFALNEAGLRIRESRLETLSIAASGALPELFDDAPVELSIAFTQEKAGGAIELDELVCELGKKGAPIFSRGTRFKFEIVTLDLRYQRPSPKEDRHFFFEITGSAEFAPDPGEFDGGLLEDLKAVRIDFVRAPLTDEFAKHIRLVVELNEPKSFGVYNLFRMEIRSIGFAPHFEAFGGPAIVLGGQMEFADIGDVIAAEIDFHSMYIGLPKQGEVLPQVHFDGLRVEISSPEGFKIAGRVDRYDSETLEGFGGEGTIQIPGFPELSAAFAFVKLRGDETEEFRRGWFVAIEAAKISYQMGALPLYLRQIGLGFGYRYTLPLIREFEQETTLRELIDRMLKALDRHQTLARLDSWVPDPEKPGQSARWTIALEAVFTLGTSQVAPFDYNARKERQVKTVIAQLLAAIRSDFTLLAAAKVWFPVSVDDFFENEEGMRNRPLARGFMIFSVPQKRFLAHAAKGKNPYLGKPNDPVPDAVKDVLNNSHFEATMLIEPSLLHAELGWPDRLMFRMSVGSLQLECRGGVLFRAENDVLVHGIFFSARGSLDLSGGVSLGFVGFRVSAHVQVYFATRLMSALYLSRPLASKIYAQVGLDIAVQFSVEAWLRIKIGFCRINISISFSFELQIMIGLDVGWAGAGEIGFRGRATVVLSVFGRRLSARVAVGLNDAAVEKARLSLLPYMTSFLEPGEIPPVPDGTLQRGRSGEIEDAVVLSESAGPNAPPSAVAAVKAAKPLGKTARNKLLQTAKLDEFVTSHISVGRGEGKAKETTLIWIMPAPAGGAFYPALFLTGGGKDDIVKYATLTLPEKMDVWVYDRTEFKPVSGKEVTLKAKPNSDLTLEVDGSGSQPVPMTLQQMLAGCYAVAPKDYVDDKGTGTKDDDEYFPQFWPGKTVSIFLPEEDRLEAALKDDRVRDPNDPARKPRRQIDPQKSKYDEILVNALDARDEGEADAYAGLEKPENDPAFKKLKRQIQEQAEGNQTYLLQTFYDDLVKLGETYEATGSWEDAIKELGDERPTILDLGMLLRIDGPPPVWAVKRSGMLNPDEYPKLTFNTDVTRMPEVRDQGFELEAEGFSLFPIVDFDMADFEKNRPVIREPVVYFDEEVVGLTWDLTWAGDAPAAAKGVETSPENFLRHYRVDFIDLSTNQPLRSYTCLPCDLAGRAERQEDDTYKRARLESRYRITVPTTDLFPESGADRQLLRRISATVLPIGQNGGIGVGRSFTLAEEPTFTPLPPDDARCALVGPGERPEAKPKSAKGEPYFAGMGWRKLSLPGGPGIARTDYWDIVLRPLERVPMGAYPNDAAEVTHRGLMSQTGQELQEGDVIIRLQDLPPGHKDIPPGMSVTRPNGKSDENGRDAADSEIRLIFDPARDDAYKPKDTQILDFTGRQAPPGSYPYVTAKSFLDGVAGDRPEGRGWRIFLRAVSDRGRAGASTAEGDKYTHSGLVPVRLYLRLPEKETGLPKQEQLDKALRPLPHFEWPSVIAKTVERRVPNLGWAAGAAHIPVPVLSKRSMSVAENLSSAIGIDYRPEPGRARAVTLAWSAVQAPGKGEALRNYASVCEYEVMRASLDDMLNADLADSDGALGFRPNWQRVARVLPSDRQVSQQTPDTMNDAQNWTAWPPSDVAIMAWMAEAGIPRKAQIERRPGWFSWAESELVWPDPENSKSTTETDETPLELREYVAAGRRADTADPVTGASPLERLAALQDIALDDMTTAQLQQLMAAWTDLSHQSVGRDLHPYLALITGRLAAAGLNRFKVTLELQASTGKPVSQTNPMKWLRENSAAIDPFGWNGLGHLGLSVNVALRDRVTGLVLPQDRLRQEIARAVFGERGVDAAIKASDVRDPGVFGRGRHLAIDLPLQTAAALRAEHGSGEVANAGLGMVQLALRPIPRHVFAYSRFTITNKFGDIDPKTTFTLPHAADLIFAGNSKRNRSFEEGATVVASAVFSAGDVVFVRHLKAGEGTGKVFGDALDAVDPARELLAERQDAILWPLPADPADVANQMTPYRKLPVPEEMLEHLDGQRTDTDENTFSHFMGYLEQAFRSLDDEGEFKQGIVSKFGEEKERRAYIDWSDRFFAVAPLDVPEGAKAAWLDDTIMRNVSFAAPKTMDPLRLSPNSQGQFSLTQRVAEEWALTRAYSLVSTRRYDALHKAVESDERRTRETPPDLQSPEYRADVQLPRVRKIEPPQVLAQRLLSDATGAYHFHEVTTASHVEATLSNSNIRMMRKIEFGGILQSFERSFPDAAWIDALNLGSTPKLPDDRRPVVEAADFDLSEHDESFLAHVPQARWGSSRMTTPSAPFYYDQTLRFLATGGEEMSAITSVPLVRPPAADPRGLPDEDKPVEITPAAWGNPWIDGDAQALFDAKQTIFESWSRTLVEDGLHPGGWLVEMRAPRLVEGLSTAGRAQLHAAETGSGTVGRLPDPGVDLHLATLGEGVTNVLAKFAPDVEVSGGFAMIPVSPSAHLGPLTVSGHDAWDDGMFLSLVASEAPGAASEPLNGTLLPDIPDEPDLRAPSSTLLASGELPSDGPLSQLAPLAIRLVREEKESETRLALLRPLGKFRGVSADGETVWSPVPRASLRASLGPSNGPSTLPMQPSDVGLGLLLLTDLERKRAAGLLSFDILRDEAATEGPSDIREVLARLELSAGAYVTPPIDLDAFPDALWDTLGTEKLELWRRMGSDGEDPTWLKVEEYPDFDDKREVLILATDPATAWTAPFDEFVTKYGDGARPAKGAELAAYREQILRFGAAQPEPRTPARLVVHAQRGSRSRIVWSKAEKEITDAS
ncbi:hypothetical protein [Ruegeria lacuscaerulensis]|uniref:hypothetical protein n=1 Tax=Ruegeria lacuscaerulensis TaxID=55218 RepID=UPI00147C2F7B|nr:hypothetical protein [Ruegeria lacuscaerulensis]